MSVLWWEQAIVRIIETSIATEHVVLGNHSPISMASLARLLCIVLIYKRICHWKRDFFFLFVLF